MSPNSQSPQKVETVGQAITRLRQSLKTYSESAALDAQVLLAYVLGRERAWVLAHPEHPFSHVHQEQLAAAETQLLAGVPLPYVLGEWEFYKLPFYVNPTVLIPRPETELLVDSTLEWLQMRAGGSRLIDVGTGSGCIAAAIAVNHPSAVVLAGDVSPQALETARANFVRHGVQECVGLVQIDLVDGLPGRFDLIVSNPPYIPSKTLDGLAVSKHEPRQALDGGLDGLDFIHRLLAAASRCLAPGGMLLAEIEAAQGGVVVELARHHFPDAHLDVLPDLAGKDRLLRIEN